MVVAPSRLLASLMAAGVVTLGLAAAAGAAVVGGTWQDEDTKSCTASKSCVLMLKPAPGPAALVIDVVTCQLRGAAAAPYEVRFDQSASGGAGLFLRLSTAGPSPTGATFIAEGNGLGYGLPAGSKPVVTARYAADATVTLTCAVTGR